MTTGVGMGDRIEVFGDVNPKRSVVVRGAERLRAGQKVRYNNERESLTAKNWENCNKCKSAIHLD